MPTPLTREAPPGPASGLDPDPVPDPPGTPVSASKGEAVFLRVRRDILIGIVTAGECLLEQRIAAVASCSQGTVREALMRLEREGLVERRGYKDTVVVRPGEREAAEMIRIREHIECSGARRSVPAFPTTTLARLERFTVHMDRATEVRDDCRLGEVAWSTSVRPTCRIADPPIRRPRRSRCARR